MFKLNLANLKSALTYGVLTLIACFSFSVVQSILNAGTIFGLDWKNIVDKGVIETLPIIVTALSLIKNLLTSDKGKFLGVITVIPEKKS